MKNYVINSRTSGLCRQALHCLNESYDVRTEIIKVQNLNDIDRIKQDIEKNKIKYFVFANGTAKVDVAIKKHILKFNPIQKMLFVESAWLTWNNFIYLDRLGIGNNSEIYTYTSKDIDNINISVPLKEFVFTHTANQLSKGIDCPFGNYILVPLQVNGDSKLIIGSPYFKKVEQFISHIIKTTPKDITILFKNHPENRHKIMIPKLDNVIDITKSKYSKKSLIENSNYVAGINSTFLIESIFLNHRTVTYGLDVFTNKDVIIEGMGKSYDDIMSEMINVKNRENFIDLLISKQYPKRNYIDIYRKAIKPKPYRQILYL